MFQRIKRSARESPRATVLAAAIFLVWLVLSIACCSVYLVADDWGCLERIMDHGIAWSFDPAAPGRLFYRPLTQDLYYRVMRTIFGLNSIVYHLFNMALHALAIILVIKIGQKLTGRREPGLWAGLLYAANPGSFLNVNFITGIQEIAQMLFSLIAVLCFISYKSGRPVPPGDHPENSPGSPAGGRLPLLVAGPLFYIISLFCKESVLFVPVWLWVYDLAAGIAARQRIKDIIRTRLRLHLPYDLPMLLYLGLRFTLMPPPTQGIYRLNFLSLHVFANLEEFARVSLVSLGLPALSGMDKYYVWLAVACAAGLALIGWAARSRKLPLPVFLGLAWLIVDLAIFAPIQGRFYPYYISYALIGLFWAAGYGLDLVFARLSKPRARLVFSLYLALVLASCAGHYAYEYQNNFIVRLARATRVIHQGITAAHPDFPPHARIVIFSDYRVHDPSHFGIRALYNRPDLEVYLEEQAYTIAYQDDAWVFIPQPEFDYQGLFAFVYTKRDGFMEVHIAPDGSVPFTAKAPGG